MKQTLELVISAEGIGRCVYGEVIDLSALGPLRITRASTVEPDGAGRWRADLAAVGGPSLGPCSSRSRALAAEARWLEENWLTAGTRATGDAAAEAHPSERHMTEFTPSIEWIKPLHSIGFEPDPLSRLLGQVRILGSDFHVNAEQVRDVDGKNGICQESVAGDTYVEQIQGLCEGPGETVRIGCREYLLVISPFQR